MAKNKFEKIRIAGIASAVPGKKRTIADDALLFGEEAYKIAESIGVKQRYITSDEQRSSDLCLGAGKKLLLDLNWELSSIDVLIYVTQTPDYFLPATGHVLHKSLGLAKTCAVFDVNLGCSGYVYGLWLASSLIASGSANRVLVLAGDTISKIISPLDRTTALLFGDAGTATVLEKSDIGSASWFELGSDGSGVNNLIVPAGGFRNRHSEDNQCGQEYLHMNGAEIFSFALREVLPLINSVLNVSEWSVDKVDAFIMHQANLFILQYLTKRLKIPMERMPLTLSEFGNTSSASIPLTITHHYAGKNNFESLKLLLVGFGVGYSWGAAAITLDKEIVLPKLIIMEE